MIYRLYFIASLIYVLLGIGHILSEFISRFFLNPKNNKLYADMSQYYIKVFGMERSIHEYMQGFSLTMGFLLFSFGALNVLIFYKGKELIVQYPFLSLFNSLSSMVIVILSVLYFHWPPIICYSISGFCFLMVYFKSRKQLSKTIFN